MAQNVTIAGASYPDVPGIDVPKTGGGTARFVDTSDANATAGDIASGKSAYVNGTKLTGTNSGSGGGSNDLIIPVELPATFLDSKTADVTMPTGTVNDILDAIDNGQHVFLECLTTDSRTEPGLSVDTRIVFFIPVSYDADIQVTADGQTESIIAIGGGVVQPQGNVSFEYFTDENANAEVFHFMLEEQNLPTVSSEDNGKVATVVNGAWSAEEPEKDVFWVDCDFNMQTMQITNISHTYSEILAAAQNGVAVKIRVHVNTTGFIAIGDLIGYPGVDALVSRLIFSFFMKVNLGSGDMISYGQVVLDEYETISLEIYDTGSTRIM